MDSQVDKMLHLRHVLLYEFNKQCKQSNKDPKATKAVRDICNVYGEDWVQERTAQRWFKQFKEGNFDLSDSPIPGRPSDFNEARLNDLIHEDPRQSTRELAE